jgi:hypothetical protein
LLKKDTEIIKPIPPSRIELVSNQIEATVRIVDTCISKFGNFVNHFVRMEPFACAVSPGGAYFSARENALPPTKGEYWTYAVESLGRGYCIVTFLRSEPVDNAAAYPPWDLVICHKDYAKGLDIIHTRGEYVLVSPNGAINA